MPYLIGHSVIERAAVGCNHRADAGRMIGMWLLCFAGYGFEQADAIVCRMASAFQDKIGFRHQDHDKPKRAWKSREKIG